MSLVGRESFQDGSACSHNKQDVKIEFLPKGIHDFVEGTLHGA